jgi:hypothetical protein
MNKLWVGLAFAALFAMPALAQDYHKNFVDCAKELGMSPDAGFAQKIESTGRVLHRWYIYNEHQQAAFSDCVARKASVAGKPSANGPRRVSR